MLGEGRGREGGGGGRAAAAAAAALPRAAERLLPAGAG